MAAPFLQRLTMTIQLLALEYFFTPIFIAAEAITGNRIPETAAATMSGMLPLLRSIDAGTFANGTDGIRKIKAYINSLAVNISFGFSDMDIKMK